LVGDFVGRIGNEGDEIVQEERRHAQCVGKSEQWACARQRENLRGGHVNARGSGRPQPERQHLVDSVDDLLSNLRLQRYGRVLAESFRIEIEPVDSCRVETIVAITFANEVGGAHALGAWFQVVRPPVKENPPRSRRPSAVGCLDRIPDEA
jgi:hypothetical protein